MPVQAIQKQSMRSNTDQTDHTTEHCLLLEKLTENLNIYFQKRQYSCHIYTRDSGKAEQYKWECEYELIRGYTWPNYAVQLVERVLHVEALSRYFSSNPTCHLLPTGGKEQIYRWKLSFKMLFKMVGLFTGYKSNSMALLFDY